MPLQTAEELQFSLDKEDSALSRLIGELTDSNGTLKADLTKDLDKVVKEFSLDNEDGAFLPYLSWLRRFAISLLKRHPATDGIKGRSRIAG